MGNCLCLKRVTISEIRYEVDKAEEAKPLVVSTVHDHVVLSSDIDTRCKKRKKVRFRLQPENAEDDVAAEATMTPPRMTKGVRVKVVLTQTELNQILKRATIYHHHPLLPSPSSVDQISGQVLVKCKRSRSSMMCKCRCSWHPVLHTIPEYGHC